MRKIYLCLLLGLFLPALTIAQQNPKIDKATFFNSEIGIDQAKKDFRKAEKYYRKGKGTYDEALKSYLKLYDYNNDSDALNYKIGICYLWTSDKAASLKYLKKSSPDVARDYYLALGRSFQYNFEYDSAKQAYNDYLGTLKPWRQNEEKEYVDQLIDECEVSEKIIADSLPAFVINLGPVINSYYDDYAATLPMYDTAIYFTSKRPEEEPKKRVSRFKFNEQVMIADECINSTCDWVEPINKINSTVNVSLAGMDKQEKRIYFYKGWKRSGDIYTAIFLDGKWKKIKKLKGINHIAYKETSISIADNGTAFFVSNRRRGQGGKDIWMSHHIKKNKYSRPVNMGELINTPFDEEAVYITRDGNTLYFSSNGHKGMGGFDVYKSIRDLDGTWSAPINMGHPINSPADELFYRPTADSMVALYSTIRGDSYGGLDIYKIQKDPRIPFKLIGTATDVEDGNVLPATVNVFDANTHSIIKTATVDTIAGIYMASFEDIGNYIIQVDFEGYKSVTDTVKIPQDRYATVVADFELEKLRHPFKLVGQVTDIDKGTPIMATLTFTDIVNDEVRGRTASDESTGNYSITFEDKFDMVIDVSAIDYFSYQEPLNTTNTTDKVLSKNIQLKRSKIEYNLTGRVIEELSGEPVHAALSFYRPGETEPFEIIVSDSASGKYNVLLDEQGPFLIEVEANGYFFLNETYQFPDGQTFTAKNFELRKMATGAKIVIENILFNTGKSTLQSQSYAELDKLVSLLKKNPSIRIEVSGHTDNVGSASVNKRISKTRALTVRNYLISQGIEEERLEYEGYGFEQPIAPNDTPEGRAQNRRVEIKILN